MDIFHGIGNLAQLCQNFGISEGGGFNPPIPLGTPLYAVSIKGERLEVLTEKPMEDTLFCNNPV
jgi:hypothetical protein